MPQDFISQTNHRFDQPKSGNGSKSVARCCPRQHSQFEPSRCHGLGTASHSCQWTQPVEIPVVASRNGQWTELWRRRGSRNQSPMARCDWREGGNVSVGRQLATDALVRYVDAKLVRQGRVLSIETADSPKLLVSSPEFIEAEESPASDPFSIPTCDTAEIITVATKGSWIHRGEGGGRGDLQP